MTYPNVFSSTDIFYIVVITVSSNFTIFLVSVRKRIPGTLAFSCLKFRNWKFEMRLRLKRIKFCFTEGGISYVNILSLYFSGKQILSKKLQLNFKNVTEIAGLNTIHKDVFVYKAFQYHSVSDFAIKAAFHLYVNNLCFVLNLVLSFSVPHLNEYYTFYIFLI